MGWEANIQNNYSYAKNINNKDFIDSVVINIIYVFGLAMLVGEIIYFTDFVHGINITFSASLLLAYIMFELRMLFYNDAIKDPDHLTSWRSLPTIGILISTPIVFLYIFIRRKELNLFSIEGIFNVWAITRYNVVNPKWLRPREDNKTIIPRSIVSCMAILTLDLLITLTIYLIFWSIFIVSETLSFDPLLVKIMTGTMLKITLIEFIILSFGPLIALLTLRVLSVSPKGIIGSIGIFLYLLGNALQLRATFP